MKARFPPLKSAGSFPEQRLCHRNITTVPRTYPPKKKSTRMLEPCGLASNIPSRQGRNIPSQQIRLGTMGHLTRTQPSLFTVLPNWSLMPKRYEPDNSFTINNFIRLPLLPTDLFYEVSVRPQAQTSNITAAAVISLKNGKCRLTLFNIFVFVFTNSQHSKCDTSFPT